MTQVQLPPQSLESAASEHIAGVETFWATPRGIVRRVRLRTGESVESIISSEDRSASEEKVDPATAEQYLLRRTTPPPEVSRERGTVRLVDLFCGCGGMTLGVAEACRALGLRLDVRLAQDIDPVAVAVFERNFPEGRSVVADVEETFGGDLGSTPSNGEGEVAEAVGQLDILVGGPPCQGHSDLNNSTRRMDPKNGLYLRMVRAAEVLRPAHILIENVPGALNDRRGVVHASVDALEDLGYRVALGVVNAGRLGVPQSRRRLILVASLKRSLDVSEVELAYTTAPRDVRWAIEDLVTLSSDAPLDTPARSAPVTRERIKYLFDHELFDLPNSQRPPCHQNEHHSYSSIYGRLAWDEPAQTITTGFYSMCMGRYVHPSVPRTITAHEAARLQFFPDFFDFTALDKRTHLAKVIGNAVPMKLSYVFALELLR